MAPLVAHAQKNLLHWYLPPSNHVVSSTLRPSYLHELHLQSSTTTSRPLSPHQLMLLMPFGSSIPSLTSSSLKRSSHETRQDGFGMSPPKLERPISPRGYARKRGSAPAFLPSHRRVVVPPMTTVDGNSTGDSQDPGSRRTTPRTQQTPGIQSSSLSSEDGDEHLPLPSPTQLSRLTVHVPMTRSLSMPILTLRELDAMRDKEADLGIVRNEGWAWVNGGFTETKRDGSDDR
jgi:hypothetical protein